MSREHGCSAEMEILDLFLGNSVPRLKNCLGLHLRLDSGCICETHLDDGGKVRVDHLVKVPFPSESKESTARSAAMNVGFFSPGAKWTGLLSQAVSGIDWHSRKVVVSLSSQFGILRYFVMPQIQRRFWNQSVPLESKKYIPIAFEEAVYDFQVHPLSQAAEGKPRMGVLFGITNRKILDFLGETLKGMGLEMMALEMAASSTERMLGLLRGGERGGCGYCHFDSNTAYVLFSEEGYPVLLREVATGGTDAHVTERRRFDVKGSLDFVNKQLGNQICDTLRVSGENLSVWRPLVERESGLKVQEWNPSSTLGLKNAGWAAYASIGASLRLQTPALPGLDISGKSKSSVEDRQAVAYVWIAGFLLAGFLLLLSLVNEARLVILGRQLAAKKSTVNDVVEFRGRSADAIEAMVEKARAKTASLSAILGDKGFITPRLEGLVNTMPGDIWISELIYSNPLVTTALQDVNDEFRIAGNIRSESDEITEINRFKEALKLDKAFSAVYAPPAGSIELSIDKSPSQPTISGMRKDTAFTIICRKKRAG